MSELKLKENVQVINKMMTPGFDVKLSFAFASDNEQLEKDIIEFDREK